MSRPMTDAENAESRALYEKLRVVGLPWQNGAYPVAQAVLAEILTQSGGTLNRPQFNQIANWIMGLGMRHDAAVFRRRYRYHRHDLESTGRIAYQHGYQAGIAVGKAHGKHKRQLAYLRGVQDGRATS